MLIQHVERYVDYRRKLGAKFEGSEYALTKFARYAVIRVVSPGVV